ncbi:hypothetical protein RI367_001195 [Sorochytrium milnesiophthora]
MSVQETAPLLATASAIPAAYTPDDDTIAVIPSNSATLIRIDSGAIAELDKQGVVPPLVLVAESKPAAALHPQPQPSATARVPAFDLLRGLIMVFMSLDHARKYVSGVDMGGEETWRERPSYAGYSWPVFLCRTVTHLSAPGFFFLMGLGAVLFARSRMAAGWTHLHIASFFFKRGAILVLLALTLFNDGLMFSRINPSDKDLQGVRVSLGVLFALGVNMFITISVVVVVLACTAPSSPASTRPAHTWTAPAVSLALAVLTWTIPLITECVVHAVRQQPTASKLLAVAFVPTTNAWLQVVYPIVPWLSPALWGVTYGLVSRSSRHHISSINMALSILCLATFVPVRLGALHSYGNIEPLSAPTGSWASHSDRVMELLTVTKYPPSLAFLLLTMGVNHLLLSLLARITTPRSLITRALLPLGQSSLFFYVTHVLLYFVLGILVKHFVFPSTDTTPAGTSLLGLMPWWLGGLLLLWSASRRYSRFKQSTPVDSLWRLF